eukprot:12913873-Prorocentrum_lima.AAC.1
MVGRRTLSKAVSQSRNSRYTGFCVPSPTLRALRALYNASAVAHVGKASLRGGHRVLKIRAIPASKSPRGTVRHSYQML